jgi:tetratricopeptide (TPR) repeat protein
MAWSNLGVLLHDQNRMEETEAAHAKSVSLQPENARFHAYHSAALRGLGKFAESEREVKTAIHLKPDYGIAYSILANTLLVQEKFAETEAACHEAIRLVPRHPWPYVYLARIARARGQIAEAEALEHEAERLRPGSTSELSIRPAEHAARLEPRLAEWLRGNFRPANALDLTVLGYIAAHSQGSYDRAADLFAKSFAERPGFAEATVEFPADRPRYLAACCAAQASRGQGDAMNLKVEDRRQRRRQALEWLRQELAHWDRQMADKRPAAHVRAYKTLNYWKTTDGWLAGVRDKPVLDELPSPERDACRKLWDAVEAALERARSGIDRKSQD